MLVNHHVHVFWGSLDWSSFSSISPSCLQLQGDWKVKASHWAANSAQPLFAAAAFGRHGGSVNHLHWNGWELNNLRLLGSQLYFSELAWKTAITEMPTGITKYQQELRVAMRDCDNTNHYIKNIEVLKFSVLTDVRKTKVQKCSKPSHDLQPQLLTTSPSPPIWETRLQ